jgi:hypothetical protein
MLEIEEAIQKIHSLASKVRNHINTHRFQSVLIENSNTWNQICSSLDVIDDTLTAIKSYTNTEFPKEIGTQYLFVYGILQALFLQQDALRHLSEAFEVDYEKHNLLKDIREIRNAAVGHPTKFRRKGETYYYHLSRISIKKKGFELLQYKDSNSTEFLKIDVLTSIKKQLNAIIENYNSIVEKLEKVDEMHKDKFRDNMLQDIFHSGMGYSFQKIAAAIDTHSPRDRDWGLKNLEIIIEVYEEFSSALSKRNEINDFTEHDLQEYFNALNKLNKFLSGKNNSMDKSDAYIYEYYIKNKNEHFISIAKEIDESYQV